MANMQFHVQAGKLSFVQGYAYSSPRCPTQNYMLTSVLVRFGQPFILHGHAWINFIPNMSIRGFLCFV